MAESVQRREWVKPELKRLEAGAAEASNSEGADGPNLPS